MAIDTQTAVDTLVSYNNGATPADIGTQLFNEAGGSQIVTEQIQNLSGVTVTPESVDLLTQLLRLIFGA